MLSALRTPVYTAHAPGLFLSSSESSSHHTIWRITANKIFLTFTLSFPVFLGPDSLLCKSQVQLWAAQNAWGQVTKVRDWDLLSLRKIISGAEEVPADFSLNKRRFLTLPKYRINHCVPLWDGRELALNTEMWILSRFGWWHVGYSRPPKHLK